MLYALQFEATFVLGGIVLIVCLFSVPILALVGIFTVALPILYSITAYFFSFIYTALYTVVAYPTLFIY